MVGMGFIALKRYDGGEGCDPKHHLSLVCHDDEWSVTENADLPFDINDAVYGSSCRGLVYFMDKRGKIVVCNLTTRKWIVFPLPDSFSHLSSEELIELEACGLGYDHNSNDYKLFRNITKHVIEKEREGEEGVGDEYLGHVEYTELYSFKNGSWKTIWTPKVAMIHPCAVYVGGSCYWTAILEPDFIGLDNDSFSEQILALDIATESFSHLSFPQTSTVDGPSDHFQVVEHRGWLGALIFDAPDDWTCSSPLHINLFVWRENTWENVLDLNFKQVERPLGLGESRDGPILFLEGKHSDRTSELMVYDFRSEELKRLGIYEYRSHMIAIFFDSKRSRLPGSIPMAFVDNKVPSRYALYNFFYG